MRASMRMSLLPAAQMLLALAPVAEATKDFSLGCAALKLIFPQKTFMPGDAVYEYEAQNFWSNTEILKPACVYRPQSALDISAALLTARVTSTEFGLRGGGHMGIPGANNIDGGPLMVLSNLTTLQVSSDKKSLWLGPASDWGEVYNYLDGYNLAVAGGRLSPVGVPGLLLAGGINFQGNQHGWAADNVIEYEIVLADGEIAYVTADSKPDLFWALKGGSSNFGIVTKFKLNTFPSKKVLAGVYSVADIPKYLAAIANFTAFNTDPLAHIVPQVVPTSVNTSIGAVIMYYDSDSNLEPDCFRPFFDIPSIANSVGITTLAAFAVETGKLVVPGINDMFIAGTTVGKTYADLLKGVQIVNDVFIGALPALYDVVPAENLSLVSVDWQPLGKLWAAGSKKSNPGGNALGFDPATKGDYLCWAEVVEWIGSEYDDAVNSWVQNTTTAIKDATKKAGIFDAFNYMGDAAGFQNIYDGYGATNKQKLLDVSRKYDPKRVFQKLLPGGFKIGV